MDIPLEELDYVGPTVAERLAEQGYHTVGDVNAADIDELKEIDGMGQTKILRIAEISALH